ncbi:hypothetical protein HPB50_011380 [Hyalomma asiaticum]|uniref:Uncharacterized protein n=1 Tax=Hyalomma asiaticum TaxID=266040 RepID=A0ACB7T726_HYAAI|nr:hypothetical protein HPB50_011380 [Hyalomma asiaticum]
MAKLCIALGLCAAAAFFSLSQFATRRGRQGDDVKALCTWLTSATVPGRLRQWALTSPLLDCASLLSQQEVLSSAPYFATSQENQYRTTFPVTTDFPVSPWSRYDEFTSTKVQEEQEKETTRMPGSSPTVTALENEQKTDTEGSTRSVTDWWPSLNDASTSTHTSHSPSHIREAHQMGWSGKTTHSEGIFTVQRKRDTEETSDENSFTVKQDPWATSYPAIADKDIEPTKGDPTLKSVTTAGPTEDQHEILPPELPLLSSMGARREITTFSFSNLAVAPQQKQTMNDKATTEFEDKVKDNAKLGAFTSFRVFKGKDTVAREFITSATPYSDIDQQETQSTIHPALVTVLMRGEIELFSGSTPPVKSDMEDKKTTSLSSTLSKLERDTYVTVSVFDMPLQPSAQRYGTASNASTKIENKTTTAPLSHSPEPEFQDKYFTTSGSLSRSVSQQSESNNTLPYNVVERQGEKDTTELPSKLLVHASTKRSVKTVLSSESDIVLKSEEYTSTIVPPPESFISSNYTYGTTPAAVDTSALSDESVRSMTTEKLPLQSREQTSSASVALVEQSSVRKHMDSPTSSAVTPPSLPNVQTATTTEPTPEEPEGPKVVCHFSASSFFRQGRGRYTPEKIDPQLCTHVIYGFTSLDNDSLHVGSAGYVANIKYDLYNRTLALKAVNLRLKVLLSLGDWDHILAHEDKCTSFASNASARHSFAQHAATFAAAHRFDGLSVDWTSFVGDECDSLPDRRNFVLLLQTDFTSVMAYDYFGTESPVVAHYSPLQSATDETNPEMSIEYVLNALIAMGAPSEKLVLGVPFHARSYTLANPRLNYIGAPANGKGIPGPVTATPGILAYYEICSAIKAGGWTTMLDPRAGVYAYSGDQWVCFDGPRSLMRKARFALKMGLAGIMASDVSMDDFAGECGRERPLLNAIHRVLYPPRTTVVARASG